MQYEIHKKVFVKVQYVNYHCLKIELVFVKTSNPPAGPVDLTFSDWYRASKVHTGSVSLERIYTSFGFLHHLEGTRSFIPSAAAYHKALKMIISKHHVTIMKSNITATFSHELLQKKYINTTYPFDLKHYIPLFLLLRNYNQLLCIIHEHIANE
jgi:hypothetical protein